MAIDKCPKCGMPLDNECFSHKAYDCGSYFWGNGVVDQSDHCKLIVANRELEEKHRRVLEVGHELINRSVVSSHDENNMEVDRLFFEELRKVLEQ